MTSVVRYGDRAVLVELDDAGQVLGLRSGLLAAAVPGLLAVVPAARTVLVEYDPDLTGLAGLTELVRRVLTGLAADRAQLDSGQPLIVPVRYDGADLAGVAEAAGLTAEQVVRHHLDGKYTVQFCGFSPGFGYLSGLYEQLRLPRLTSPRPVVPAGSVAIADGYTGIYPRPSPGGWRLIGHTELDLFDLNRDPPALLWPGRPVRFVQQ